MADEAESYAAEHHPECNRWCTSTTHYLESSGPQGAAFSHQEPATQPPSDKDAGRAEEAVDG